jgi:hypothetical protein
VAAVAVETAEASLLSTTVGAAARLAAAAELARSRASDAADVRLQLEAATQAKTSLATLLTVALRKGLTPQAKREMGAEARATQTLAAAEIPRLETEMTEEIEMGRRAPQKRAFVKHRDRANELQEQLLTAKVTLEEATAKARTGPTLGELEAALKKQYSPQDVNKAESAARTRLGVADKARVFKIATALSAALLRTSLTVRSGCPL